MQGQTDNVALMLICILARNLQRRLSQGTFLKNGKKKENSTGIPICTLQTIRARLLIY